MAEPTTTTTAVTLAAGGITVTTALLGMDTEVATGALVGAAIFVVSAKELNLPTRIIYLLASVVLGYILTPEIVKHTFIQAPAVAGLVGGLLGVSGCKLLLKQLDNTDLSWLIGGRKK